MALTLFPMKGICTSTENSVLEVDREILEKDLEKMDSNSGSSHLAVCDLAFSLSQEWELGPGFSSYP